MADKDLVVVELGGGQVRLAASILPVNMLHMEAAVLQTLMPRMRQVNLKPKSCVPSIQGLSTL